jgi:surface antigen
MSTSTFRTPAHIRSKASSMVSGGLRQAMGDHAGPAGKAGHGAGAKEPKGVGRIPGPVAGAAGRPGRKTARGGGRGSRLATGLGDRLADGFGRADAHLMQNDHDEADRMGVMARSAVTRGARTATSSTASIGRGVWRHRKAPVKAAKATANGARIAARVSMRVVRATVAMVRRMVKTVTGPLALPLLPIVAVILCVVLLISSITALFTSASETSDGLRNVPAEYEADVRRAGGVCAEITPALIAAQIERESGWDPHATSPAGAQGIAQFMPGTWAGSGMDGDGDGKRDVMNPHDAIWSQGNLMCSLADQVKALKTGGTVAGDTVRLALAAYNAGLGAVTRAGGIPDIRETRDYVDAIMASMAKYQGEPVGGGAGQTGQLSPKLNVTGDIVSTAGIDLSPGSTYGWGQCTWWAAIRRAQIGRPVDPYMGNGGDWAAKARLLGMQVSGAPRPGDAICFGRGVLGADRTFGHIAIVESVGADGGILISEANAKGTGVVSTRSFTAGQLAAVGSGVQFIH